MSQSGETRAASLVERVALVTGAASGIGEATALLFARQGGRVAVADIDSEGAGRTVEQITAKNGHALAIVLDVTSESAWERAIEQVQRAWGQLDILVNCAGIAWAKPIIDTSLDEWRQLMAVNLDGVFLGTKHGLRAMRGRGGAIINVSSVWGTKAAAGSSAYCTSKAALGMMSKVAALEGAPDNIRVNVVLPGGVITPMWDKQGTWWQELVRECGSKEAAFAKLGEDVPLRRFARPEEIAEVILYLASDQSALVTGADLIVDGGFAL